MEDPREKFGMRWPVFYVRERKVTLPWYGGLTLLLAGSMIPGQNIRDSFTGLPWHSANSASWVDPALFVSHNPDVQVWCDAWGVATMQQFEVETGRYRPDIQVWSDAWALTTSLEFEKLQNKA